MDVRAPVGFRRRLLQPDRRRWVYAITPTDVRSVWGGYYEPRTLIWRNRWITRHGIVECRQALAFPGDPDRVVLLRRLTGCRGTARLRVLLARTVGRWRGRCPRWLR